MRRSLAPSKRKVSPDALSSGNSIGSSSDGSAQPSGMPTQLGRQPAYKPLHLGLGAANAYQSISSKPKHTATTTSTDGSEECYKVVYRKQTTKVHKTWDGDGFLIVDGSILCLKDHLGNFIASGRKSAPLQDGSVIRIGQKEVEITESVSTSDMQRSIATDTTTSSSAQDQESTTPNLPSMPKFKSHRIPSMKRSVTQRNTPYHDPKAPYALVMPRPKHVADTDILDVVVDPILSRKLRPHQRDGVIFLYECVMGMRDHDGNGAILADEMGLGKTLQTITLIWTCLKQTPIIGEHPMRRVLIVCPASLVGNWRKEFKKWLGDQRIHVYAVQGAKADVSDFVVGRVYSVMIIGYERLRLVQQTLSDAKFDMIVCDEGHRLKNSGIQASQILQSFTTRRRILLSGTPIQNDLSEFYAMVDFVNPGVLGSRASFKRRFEDPIVSGRAVEANDNDRELGQSQMHELTAIIESFVLRRTAEINTQYLPDKTEVVLFCRMSSEQTDLYRKVVSSTAVQRSLATEDDDADDIELEERSGEGSSVLCAMTCLRKCASVPSLIAEDSSILEQLDHPPSRSQLDCIQSGKMRVLKQLLVMIRAQDGINKVVLVSNWTATLDVFEAMCHSSRYSFERLDGQTPSHKRQSIVDKFNESQTTFLFLLSSKAGGVGLNLTGANRLVLFDLDWNPSVDLQAMARVWRDGQRQDVTIYRMLSTGTIEERIFQRQVIKMSLSSSVMDGNGGETNKFSRDELRDIFSLDTSTASLTHDGLGCKCDGQGTCDASDLGGWNHYASPFPEGCRDIDGGLMGSVLDKTAGIVSFVVSR